MTALFLRIFEIPRILCSYHKHAFDDMCALAG